MDLAVDVASTGPATIVRLTGDVGLGTLDRLRSAVLKCLADEPSGVVLDLDGTTVASPAALGMFGTLARRAAQWPGVLLVLAVSDGPLRELLRHTGLDKTVPTYASVTAALGSLGGLPPRQNARMDLPADTGSSALARRFVTTTCAAWHVAGLTENACLIASELVENAVLHGHSRAELQVELRRGVLTIAVRDDGPGQPERRAVAGAPTGGRGLFMVDDVARAWGYAPTWGGGKVVWAVLATTACGDNHP